MRRVTKLATVVAVILLVLGLSTVPSSAKPKGPLPDLTISTLPAYAGYPVTFDGVQTLTDAQGVARFPGVGDKTPSFSERVKVAPQEFNLNGVRQRVEPARVYDNGKVHVVVLNVFYLVDFTFKNSNNGPLDASVIKDLVVKNSIGAITTVPAHQASWLQGSRVVPLTGGLQVKKLYWTVQDVKYAGASVVNASQQRFLPADGQTFQVTLLFYSARVRVHDALFGFRRTAKVVLKYPDNTTRGYTLDSKGAVNLPSLARGNYSVQIAGFGPKVSQQLAISTNQDLDLKYYSWVDIGVILAVALFFSLGLLTIGLRRRRRIKQRRKAAAELEAAGAADAVSVPVEVPAWT
jgi:hypothetical protein